MNYKKKYKDSLPQVILTLFLILLYAAALFLKLDLGTLFSRSIDKFVMNGIIVLAMIPTIVSGIGLNFGISVGIVSGLLGMLISIELRLKGIQGFLLAIIVSIPIAYILGYIYSLIIKKAKGSEDIAAIFIGYSFIPFMNIFWTVLPFTNREMLFPVGGSGLRPKISLRNYFGNVLNDLGRIKIGNISISLGMIGIYALISIIIYIIMKSRFGLTMEAAGENESYARISGINVERSRRNSIILSMIIGAIGIIVYAQSYGFVELYDSPGNFSFAAVCAILIGGSNAKKATILNAVIGTYLYQSIYLLSSPIANLVLRPQMSEIVRMIITNSIILYAFIRRRGEFNDR